MTEPSETIETIETIETKKNCPSHEREGKLFIGPKKKDHIL